MLLGTDAVECDPLLNHIFQPARVTFPLRSAISDHSCEGDSNEAFAGHPGCMQLV